VSAPDVKRLPVVYSLVAELAGQLKVSKINQLPGAWVCQVDRLWVVAANGHREPVRAEPDGCMAADLRPFEMAVWFNGWLAGLFTPSDGFVCVGAAGNEDELIRALLARIERETDDGRLPESCRAIAEAMA